MRKAFFAFPVTVLALAGTVAGLVAWNIHTFNRLTDEAVIARLRFVALGPQHYRVELRTGDFCIPQEFELYGDQWRIDARFLKWKPWANLFGMDAMYRLERIGGRYRSIEDENRRRHLAWRIGDLPAVDLVEYMKPGRFGWSPVDTEFGSSVYETIDPGYEYVVFRTQSGLLVRKKSIAPAHYEDGTLVIHIDDDCAVRKP